MCVNDDHHQIVPKGFRPCAGNAITGLHEFWTKLKTRSCSLTTAPQLLMTGKRNGGGSIRVGEGEHDRFQNGSDILSSSSAKHE